MHEVLVDQEYEFLTDFLLSLAAPNIVDVGAHIGTFAVWSFGVNSRARILSVEADPDTFRVMEMNITEFKKLGSSWQAIRAAAGRENGVLLRMSNTGPSMSHRIDPDGSIEVESISLGSLLDRVEASGSEVDLVKIDIEGSEEAFVCTDPEALKRIGVLVIELHPNICDSDRVSHVLAQYFDRIDYIDARKSTKPLLYCRRSVHCRSTKKPSS